MMRAFFIAMAQLFVQGNGRKSFDGYLLLAQDLTTIGTVYSFADESIEFEEDTNNSYPLLIDGVAYQVNKVAGLPLGRLRIRGVWQGDRGIPAVITAAFGARTGGKLTPWLANIVPYAGGTSRKFAGIFFDTFTLTGQFGVTGQDAMMRYELTAIVCDPFNAVGLGALTAPASLGTSGLGISSFNQVGITDGQGSPTIYTDFEGVQVMFVNGQTINKTTKLVGGSRISSGCTPGTIQGRIIIPQDAPAGVALPQAQGTYPLQVIVPTGDLSASTKFDLSSSWDARRNQYMPNDFQNGAQTYTLFGISAGATTTANYPFVITYA